MGKASASERADGGNSIFLINLSCTLLYTYSNDIKNFYTTNITLFFKLTY